MRSQRAAEPTQENIECPLNQAIIISVMHTGTHFVAYDIFRGWQQWQTWTPDREEELNRMGRGYMMHHFGEVPLAHLKNKAADGHTIVIPMRRMRDVVASWVAKGRELHKLKAMVSEAGAAWDAGIGWWLPLDTDQRYDRLMSLAARVPINTQTKWEPVHYEGKRGCEVTLTGAQEQFAAGLESSHRMFSELGYVVKN